MEGVVRTDAAALPVAAERLTGDRVRRVVGWSLAALTLALFATVPLSLAGDVMSRPRIQGSGPEAWYVVFVAAFALPGAALIHLRPRNWIGWILVGSGLLQVTSIAADVYSARALTDPDQSLPLGLAAAWLASWTWLPSLLLPVLVLPPLYPTGHPPSRYWVWHLRVALAGIGVAMAALAFGPGGVDDTVRGTELPFTPPGWTTWIVVPVMIALVGAATASTVIGTLVRVVRATYPERQQLLWLLCVVGAMLATVFTEYRLLFVTAYCMVPVAVVVGVLRYHLLGIEVALRRTLLYLPMTLLVALVVGGLTTLLARLAPEGPLPLLAASAVVAVLVIPVAARLRVVVDRVVLGERADPLTVVDRLGAGLEVPQDDPVAAMLEAVASAVGATSATVRDPGGDVVARVGPPGLDASGHSLVLPLRHGGTLLGTLAVAPRRGSNELSAPDARLLAALAPHLAVVVSSHRLTEELGRERNRVMAATLQERDRLRRDLHDGLGPSLSGIALGIEAAQRAHDVEPDAVPALLDRTREEAASAVREVRRVLEGLRPRALDVSGLEGAVRDTARSLGMGLPGGPTFELRSDPLPPLPPRLEEAVFRIIAESMTNVARHSGARHCSVELARSNGDLRVGVTDDGSGVDLGAVAGHGLESMRRRAVDLGGTLAVDASAPHGTRVLAVLPLGVS